MRRAVLPTRMIGILMAIGFIDLLTTAVLHAQGQIVEVNPLMKPLIEHSEWLFAVVKGLTLVIGWAVMARYSQKNIVFVRQACLVGSIVYVLIWTVGFFAAAAH